jgi:hypothetical protein
MTDIDSPSSRIPLARRRRKEALSQLSEHKSLEAVWTTLGRLSAASSSFHE